MIGYFAQFFFLFLLFTSTASSDDRLVNEFYNICEENKIIGGPVINVVPKDNTNFICKGTKMSMGELRKKYRYKYCTHKLNIPGIGDRPNAIVCPRVIINEKEFRKHIEDYDRFFVVFNAIIHSVPEKIKSEFHAKNINLAKKKSEDINLLEEKYTFCTYNDLGPNGEEFVKYMYEEKYQNDSNPCAKRKVDSDLYNNYLELSSSQFCNWKKNTCNRLLGEIKGLDAQKLEEWKKSVDEKRLAEEKKLAEDKKAEEIKRIAEERRANEERLKIAEIKKVEEERARAEELRIIEENRRLEEERAKEQERLRKEKRIADLNEIYGFRCEWIEWNDRGSEAFNTCLEEKAYQSEQELLREENERQDEIARAKEEEAIQIAKAKEIALKKENDELQKKEREVRAKMIELKYAELEDSYGYKCQSSGNLNNKDKFRKCLTKTAEEEQERQRVQSENELRLAKIELEIAKTNAKNKELEAEIASVKADNMKILKEQADKQKKANDEARLAMIAAQNAANEYARQQNALLEKQLNEEKSRRNQQALMNFLGVVSGIYSQPTTQRVPSKNCFLEHAGGEGAFSNDYWLNC